MMDFIMHVFLCVFLSEMRFATCGYCGQEDTLIRYMPKVFDFFWFKIEVPVREKYPEYTCCEGYHGAVCDQITETCRANLSCRGEWCETKEFSLCDVEEEINKPFMGKKTRLVKKPCEDLRTVEHCCTGFSGPTCSQRKHTDLLTKDEEKSVKEQIENDEGKKLIIYSFDGKLKFGIGHVIKKEEPEFGQPPGAPVSDDRINEAFEADLHIAISDVAELFKESKTWPFEAKNVAVNIMFNTKIQMFKQMANLVASLANRNWVSAADVLESSAWYSTVKTRGMRLVSILRNLPETDNDLTVQQNVTTGGFTAWSQWSKCTFKCAGGLRFERVRTRSCSKIKASGTDSFCDGKIMERGAKCNISDSGPGDKDHLCKCKSGQCQFRTSSPCASGLYETGLCQSKPDSDYQCCLPVPEKLHCTNGWTKYYACKLLDLYSSRKIGLTEVDGHGNRYSAPAQNIRDACQGKSASRSYYTDKDCPTPGAPGGEVCLTATLLKFTYDVTRLVSGIKVTALVGLNHVCTSYHYKGKAVDISGKNISGIPVSDWSKVKDLCKNSLNGGYIDTYRDGHIHCTVEKPDSITDPDPDGPCEDRNGICQENTEKCGQPYKTGLCGGGATRQCCVWTIVD